MNINHINTFNYVRLVNSCHIVFPDGHEDQRICFRECFQDSGRNCLVGPFINQDGRSSNDMYGGPKECSPQESYEKNLREDWGWDEESFMEYIELLHEAHPAFPEMLKGTTFTNLKICLSSPVPKERYLLLCFFRLIWENPHVAQQLLVLRENGFNAVDMALFVVQTEVRPCHWFMSSYKAPYSREDLEKRFFDPAYDGANGVDRGVFHMADFNHGDGGRPAPDSTVDELLEHTAALIKNTFA